VIPATYHHGMFRDLSILCHALWGLMSQRVGFEAVHYGPIYMKKSMICPCMVCAAVRSWYADSRWGTGV